MMPSSRSPHALLPVLIKKPPKAKATSLSDVWFRWFAEKLWTSTKSRQRQHDFKILVAFMKLFLPSGFDVDSDDLTELGEEAERNAIDFLRLHHSTAKSFGTVVQAFKALNREGKMNQVIERYGELVRRGKAVDSSPPSAQFLIFRC